MKSTTLGKLGTWELSVSPLREKLEIVEAVLHDFSDRLWRWGPDRGTTLGKNRAGEARRAWLVWFAGLSLPRWREYYALGRTQHLKLWQGASLMALNQRLRCSLKRI